VKRSLDRILTTHTGSLVRPPRLLEFARARQRGESIDQQAFDRTLADAVHDVVARQTTAGIDIPNDGEFGKSTSWSLYALKRLSGFELREVKGGNPFARGADRERFADFYAELEGRGDGKDWSNVTRQDAVCVGPIKYNGLFELQRDIDNLKAATKATDVDEAFLRRRSRRVCMYVTLASDRQDDRRSAGNRPFSGRSATGWSEIVRFPDDRREGLQILSLTLFDKQPLDQLLAEIESRPETVETRNQLNLFSDISGQ